MQPRAFTLIELLVVIAIIGILSAVVLASLSSASGKGGDAAVKANFQSIITESNIYFDKNGAFGTNAAAAGISQVACTTANTFLLLDTNVVQAISAADKAASGSGAATPTKVQCSISINGAAWLIFAPLNAAGAGYWCVDSRDIAKPEAAAPSGAVYACP